MFPRWTSRSRVRFYFAASAVLFVTSGEVLLSHGGVATALPLVFAIGMLIRALVEGRNVERDSSAHPPHRNSPE